MIDRDRLIGLMAGFESGADMGDANPFSDDPLAAIVVADAILAYLEGHTIPDAKQNAADLPGAEVEQAVALAAFLQGLAVGHAYATEVTDA